MLHLSHACAHVIKACKIQLSDCLRTLWVFFGGTETTISVFLHDKQILCQTTFIILSQKRKEKRESFTMARCGFPIPCMHKIFDATQHVRGRCHSYNYEKVISTNQVPSTQERICSSLWSKADKVGTALSLIGPISSNGHTAGL
jgi:hypothetical protein